MFDVDMHEAEVVVVERPLSLGRPVGRWSGPAVQPLAPQDAPDAVAVEMRQEMAQHEGEVVESEAGRTPQGADDGTLLLARLPGQSMWAGGMVEAIRDPALAPLADGFGADAVAPGQHAAGLSGAGDLGAGDRGGACVWVDVEHASPLSWYGGQAFEPPGMLHDSQSDRIPTMFRDQTARHCR